MNYVLLFVLLMIIAVAIRLAASWLRGSEKSGGDDSSSDDDDTPELDLIDPDEMPGHTGGCGCTESIHGGNDASLSQDQLRDMFDLYAAKK